MSNFSSLTVITSWVSFWIDVDAAPGRITLGLMSILTIITQILDVRKIVPAINYVMAIDIWLFVCLVFVFCSFIEYAFAYTMVRKVLQYSTCLNFPIAHASFSISNEN